MNSCIIQLLTYLWNVIVDNNYTNNSNNYVCTFKNNIIFCYTGSIMCTVYYNNINHFCSNNAFSQLPIFAINAFSPLPFSHFHALFINKLTTNQRLFLELEKFVELANPYTTERVIKYTYCLYPYVTSVSSDILRLFNNKFTTSLLYI